MHLDMKNRDFQPVFCFILVTTQDGAIVTV